MIHNSELRKDPVSGDWVVVAPGRARRPQQFIEKNKIKRVAASKKTCPFENPQKNGHDAPFLVYPQKNKNGKSKSNWFLQVIENKFPVFLPGPRPTSVQKGPFQAMKGVGRHELVITRDHNKDFPALAKEGAALVLRSFQERYLALSKDRSLSYISIFHNWGPRSGASVYHPHYQIIALPILPPDIGRSLAGSQKYRQKTRRCVHCEMISWEKKNRNRIIFENKGAVCFAPFASREPFEFRVFPKKHFPWFEKTPPADLNLIAAALQKVLGKMKKKLGDPDYNFFIHTAPVAASLSGKNDFSHYHWHIEVLPKFSISAGFELGTGIETAVVDPEKAAAILRK